MALRGLLALAAAGLVDGLSVGLRAGAPLASGADLALAQTADAEAAPTAIQRVVKLLEEMRSQLQKEADADAATYNKMVCWCQTNDKEKTKAIADADSRISELEAEVGERSGRNAELATKIEHLKQELAEKKASLESAIALREKEHAAFNAAEVELVQGVAMLRNAIEVLRKHHEGFVQLSPGLKEGVGAAVSWALMRREEMLALRHSAVGGSRGGASLLSLPGAPPQKQEAVLRSLGLPRSSPLPVEYAAKVLADAASAGGKAFVQESASQPAPFQSYAPRSSQIFGILQQMLEEFQGNLDQSQQEELAAQEEFAGLKAALEAEISTSTTKLDDLEADHAQNVKALADAKEDLTETRGGRSADVQFLSDLRLKCQDLDHQHQQRTKARGEEIRAVGDAINILTEDDARTLFQKKMGTGSAFVQVASNAQERLRASASAMLMAAADRLQLRAGQKWRGEAPSQQLTAVALQVQLDSFTEVKKAIDTMIAQLKEEQKSEADHKAFCTKSLNQNEKDTYHTEQALADVTDRIAALEAELQKLSEEIQQAHEAIAKMEVDVKAASELRKRENAEFQEEVVDQRAVQQILAKAVKRLRLVYKEASLAQEKPEPPEHFQPYKANAGASPVIGLIEQIIEDSKAAEQEALASEQAAQSAYAQYVNDARASIKAFNAAIESKTKVKAETEAEKGRQESERMSLADKLDSLHGLASDLHAQCDFVLKNFSVRQKARMEEIEALGQVKALLSGMAKS